MVPRLSLKAVWLLSWEGAVSMPVAMPVVRVALSLGQLGTWVTWSVPMLGWSYPTEKHTPEGSSAPLLPHELCREISVLEQPRTASPGTASSSWRLKNNSRLKTKQTKKPDWGGMNVIAWGVCDRTRLAYGLPSAFNP